MISFKTVQMFSRGLAHDLLGVWGGLYDLLGVGGGNYCAQSYTLFSWV